MVLILSVPVVFIDELLKFVARNFLDNSGESSALVFLSTTFGMQLCSCCSFTSGSRLWLWFV
jgi:hypothetical protein